MNRSAVVTAIGTLALAVAAGVTLVLTFGGGDSPGDSSADVAVDAGGDACSGDGSSSVTCIFGDSVSAAERQSDDEIRETTFEDPPTVVSTQGPWPFIVYDDGGIGLKVRTTNTEDGVHIGGIATRNTAWVLCQEESTFNPDPSRGVGGLWYKVAWPNQEASTEFFSSQPSDETTGWSFAGYLDPVGHNGDVPTC